MGFTEEHIGSKIDHIADTFLGITGKSASSKTGLSITEYLEIRKQAIWEISQGFDSSWEEINCHTPKKTETKEIASTITKQQTLLHPPQEVEARKENVTVTEYSIANTDVEESDSVREKFRRLKDL